MDDQDRRERRLEVDRGHRAQTFIEDPMIADLFDTYREALLDRMSDATTSDVDVLDCRRMLVVVQRVRNDLMTMATTGKLALQQLEDDRNG